MACATQRPMQIGAHDHQMGTPRHLDEVRNFPLSPPPPPGGYDPCEIAECGFPEFIPLHRGRTNHFPIQCILDEGLPQTRQKTIQPPKVDLSELQKNPKAWKLQLPNLEKPPSITKKSTLHIRPRKGLPASKNGASDPMELMKAFVKKNYAHKTGNQTAKREEKVADRPHELTEVFVKKSVPKAVQHAEVRSKLGEHLNIGRTIQLDSSERKKRQVRRSYAALGA
uniref:Uncharacterized protein n=1 Tax=Helicotheca tamesis TaxID=374047 RepID=A0A7S2MIP0_9STRA|mmetsp:Transcript_16625/g.22787  ORF Transcript_16625/g.22787 Transcript_16625/m.22787 type:complete len:225 (+) Transcript_16625:111-785(+)|eukprot:CAMPEP_0185729588 /NCGR_PEP_ID=MMETSP1171-20130828/6452_1 /TAXON_ID=374046 /ORGANISM="Helicotheca tamensis, Strain CCMP826" /LENGTH=224 /DNA_ID=CAMNT_0028398463 /DNA_START=9 /DNA_END=683 /DNA_ORIENTATION=+